MDPTLLEAFAKALAKETAHEVVALLRAGDAGMVDQGVSPLGRRRHCAAVRRRVQNGEGGAAIVGRRMMLTAEAVEQELARASSKPSAAPKSSVRDALDRELRLVGGRK